MPAPVSVKAPPRPSQVRYSLLVLSYLLLSSPLVAQAPESHEFIDRAHFEENCHIPKDEIWVIDFWASWCGPCIKSIPHLTRIQSDYAAQGVRIIGISVDTDEAAWQAARARFGMEWSHFRHTTRDPKDFINKNFRFSFLPTYFVIDRSGKQRRMKDLDKLERWLQKNTSLKDIRD